MLPRHENNGEKMKRRQENGQKEGKGSADDLAKLLSPCNQCPSMVGSRLLKYKILQNIRVRHQAWGLVGIRQGMSCDSNAIVNIKTFPIQLDTPLPLNRCGEEREMCKEGWRGGGEEERKRG